MQTYRTSCTFLKCCSYWLELLESYIVFISGICIPKRTVACCLDYIVIIRVGTRLSKDMARLLYICQVSGAKMREISGLIWVGTGVRVWGKKVGVCCVKRETWQVC